MDDFLKRYGTLEFVASRIRKIKLFVSLAKPEIKEDTKLEEYVSRLARELDEFQEKTVEILRTSLSSLLELDMSDADRRSVTLMAFAHVLILLSSLG